MFSQLLAFSGATTELTNLIVSLLVTDARTVYHDVDPLHPLHVHRPNRTNVSGNTHLPTVVVDVGL